MPGFGGHFEGLRADLGRVTNRVNPVAISIKRLQQMAMEENSGRYRGSGGRRHHEYEHEELSGDFGNGNNGNNIDRGGMKRQMNSQGGNRGKKNRGGWNR